MTTDQLKPRWFVPPLGWPFSFRVVTIHPAERQRRLLHANRYTRQIIGVSVRLPSCAQGISDRHPHHTSLSIVWSKPARWWKR